MVGVSSSVHEDGPRFLESGHSSSLPRSRCVWEGVTTRCLPRDRNPRHDPLSPSPRVRSPYGPTRVVGRLESLSNMSRPAETSRPFPDPDVGVSRGGGHPQSLPRRLPSDGGVSGPGKWVLCLWRLKVGHGWVGRYAVLDLSLSYPWKVATDGYPDPVYVCKTKFKLVYRVESESRPRGPYRLPLT